MPIRRSCLRFAKWKVAITATGVIAGCGGGGGSDGTTPAPTPTMAQRIQAAQSAANSGTNTCSSIKPFYWEIGDATGTLPLFKAPATVTSVPLNDGSGVPSAR